MSMGQAIGPPVDIAWGMLVGCGVVSFLALVASAGSGVLWSVTMVVMLLLEPLFNHKSPMMGALTAVFVVVIIDNVLLNGVEEVLGRPVGENSQWIQAAWPSVFKCDPLFQLLP